VAIGHPEDGDNSRTKESRKTTLKGTVSQDLSAFLMSLIRVYRIAEHAETFFFYVAELVPDLELEPHNFGGARARTVTCGRTVPHSVDRF
jgi:hypothetical protein